VTQPDRTQRQRDRLEKAVTELADVYDPRPRQARDMDDSGLRWDGLYVQLTRALGLPGREAGGEGRSGKPGSRPPGWRSDVSALLGTIDQSTKLWQPTVHDVVQRLRNVPHIVEDHEVAARAADLSGWVSRATLALGYRRPSQELPGVSCQKRHLTRSGWREVGCGNISLRVREGGSVVWCSTPSCHDSVEWPDCKQDEAGAWSCRDSDGDRTHAITFTKDEWLQMWARMQRQGAA